MRRSRFTEEQIITVLREHDAGVKTAELCRRHGISDAPFYNWKAKFGGMAVSEVARLRALETRTGGWPEGRRSQQASGGIDARRFGAEGPAGKKLIRPADRFAAMEKLVGDHGLSERRACRLIGANRSAWQYEPVRGDDGAARERLRNVISRQAEPEGEQGSGSDIGGLDRDCREQKCAAYTVAGESRGAEATGRSWV